jgi:hypothetical protein
MLGRADDPSAVVFHDLGGHSARPDGCRRVNLEGHGPASDVDRLGCELLRLMGAPSECRRQAQFSEARTRRADVASLLPLPYAASTPWHDAFVAIVLACMEASGGAPPGGGLSAAGAADRLRALADAHGGGPGRPERASAG